METSVQRRNSNLVASYTMTFKSFKKVEADKRVKMREVKIYRNSVWIYCDAYMEEERELHEQWAKNFLHAMKIKDTKAIMKALDEMCGLDGTTPAYLRPYRFSSKAKLMKNKEASCHSLVLID
ncbi:hypothetical protein CLV24_11917 [Pontibacter ummariensis]|uniref:Uncharacterized protein n=1 Tax=Pontibacter ummariensis TaxID=1610492 RepID=A0A239IXX8_9BACT|nr:hypothetical protein [Pontibacter ummariensis]PRY08967.1 hypothetical protein CLV24_11917 [Pontibacter ummariensis]SNS97264.1 hypothetical protein SAMN06296052_11917 [Pontibacter ummariensis]